MSKLVKFQYFGNKNLADAAIGDFYMSDGTLVDKDADLTDIQKEECIGIVMKAGRDSQGSCKDDCTYKQKDGKTDMNAVHGYVLALYDAYDGESCAWGSLTTEVEYMDMMNREQSGFYAVILFAAKESKTLKTDFPAIYWVTNNTEGYEYSYPAPTNSSGWFLPSAGQCQHWIYERNELLSSVRKATGDNDYVWKGWYWSSSESYYGPSSVAYYAEFYDGSNYVGFDNKDSYNFVRACLAF